jgi:hypothetical protein
MPLTDAGHLGEWSSDWLWGIPMIVLTITMHSAGLLFICSRLVHSQERLLHGIEQQRRLTMAALLAALSLAIALLFALSAVLWALAYLVLGALPSFHLAIYYSLTMITTTGYDGVALAPHWRLMGVLEAVSGVLLGGISTAFLFAILERMWRPR